ncbi:GDYXXLXY domain-containing protein [Fluviicola sp.]|uniref:GDYXXLXY domain-containing protein n=1 Tax=Fluviicola sp. TaxID=1917219 RepID=UPI0026033D80|nr:GDYXXLXY domain-containing protein [Fluviicola sp.]
MNKLRWSLLAGNLVLIVVVFTWMLRSKEQLLQKGDVLVLKLQPADPRSFMMGDYMTLNYDINDEIPTGNSFDDFHFYKMNEKKRTNVVVKMNDSLAVFVRLHNKEALDKGEFVLPCEKRYFNYEILPNEYLFQEGRAKHFNRAEYAQFRVNKSGDVIIECLLDKNRKALK